MSASLAGDGVGLDDPYRTSRLLVVADAVVRSASWRRASGSESSSACCPFHPNWPVIRIWRRASSPGASPPLPGADVSVTAPALVRETTLRGRSVPEAPTAVGWTQAFWFPCDRPMTIARGVIEPPLFATAYEGDGIDNVCAVPRGGSPKC